MKTKGFTKPLALSIAMLVVMAIGAGPLSAMSAHEIMKASDSLSQPKTLKSLATMTIQKAGETLTRTISLTGIKDGANEKILARIVEEPSGNETRVLTHTNRGGDDRQWVKLPNGKIKLIASGDRSGVFVNSHIFYEDIRSRHVDDYTYRSMGSQVVEGHDCHVIEALPKPGKSIYRKGVFYVIKSGAFGFFIVRADIYYKSDKSPYKRLINYNLKKIDGIITPHRAVMYKLDDSGNVTGSTTVEIKKLKFNDGGITESLFNSNRL